MLDDESTSVNDISNEISHVLLQTASETMGVKKIKRFSKTKNNHKPWFNAACKIHRSRYYRAKHVCKQFNNEFNNENLKRCSKEYKKTLRLAERSMIKRRNNELLDLKVTDAKEYWKRIRDNKKNSCPIEMENLFNHFQSINVKVDVDSDEESTASVDSNFDLECLNSPITKQEVESTIKRLKNGKAAGNDCIINEYLRNSIPLFSDIYCKLFNKVLDTGIIPDEWLIGLVLPIFKGKGVIKTVIIIEELHY